MTGDAFLAAVRGAEPAGAQAAMPKFQNEYKAVLNDDLIAMGMPATAVSISAGSPAGVDPYTVTLDRPFVYAIVDTATGLPLFIGTVMEVAQ